VQAEWVHQPMQEHGVHSKWGKDVGDPDGGWGGARAGRPPLSY